MKGQTTKYLKYAIGEIILVVIGILIALQINNWNLDRKEHKKEQVLMQSFIEDLARNCRELERVIKKSERVAAEADSLLYFRAGKIEIEDTEKLLELISGVTSYTKFLSYDATINEIMNSGSLDIISNDYLRKAMASWDGDLKFLREITELRREESKELDIIIRDRLPQFEFKKAALDQSPLPDNTPILELINFEPFWNRLFDRSQDFMTLNSMFRNELDYHQTLIDTIIANYPKINRPKILQPNSK